MATMRSYSFIIASSTAFARPFTIASIYCQGSQFPSSRRLPPTLLRRASFTNPRSGSSCRRRSRILRQHDPFCNIKIAATSSSIPTTTTSSFFSEIRVRYNPPSAMICLTSSRNIITNTPPRTSSPSSLLVTSPIPSTATTTTITTRLFGCNPNNSPHATPGDIFLSDDRDDDIDNITTSTAKSTISIDLTALRNTIQVVREIIGYPTYDVSLTLVNDTYMQQLNADSRGISSPTDILSFSPRDDFVEPGVLKEEQFDREEYYDLGELFIDVDYVQRRCEEDRALHAAAAMEEQEGGGRRRETLMLEGEVVSEIGNVIPSQHDKKRDAGEDDDADANPDDYEYGYMEVEVDDEYYYEDEYDDRGVAPAMQYIYDPEVRIHMLVVHGMLHLVGYDHETDDDYELMVVREDEVLAELKRRLGEDFGLQRRLPSLSCE